MTPADRNRVPGEGEKRCPLCGDIYPNTPDHFSVMPKTNRRRAGKAIGCTARCCREDSAPEPTADDFNTAAMYRAPGTSSAAAAKAAKSARLNATHRTLYRMLKEQPRTPDELARETGMVLNTVRARLSELKSAGWIAPTGETRATEAGEQAEVLAITTKRQAA